MLAYEHRMILNGKEVVLIIPPPITIETAEAVMRSGQTAEEIEEDRKREFMPSKRYIKDD